MAKQADLVRGLSAEPGLLGGGAVIGDLLRGGLGGRLVRSGRMAEGDGDHPDVALSGRQRGRKLDEALGRDEIHVKGRSEWIETPGDAGGVGAAAAEEGVVESGTEGGLVGEFSRDGAADGGEEVLQREPGLREETIGG